MLLLLFNFINYEKIRKVKCQNPSVPGASLRGGNFDVAKISLQWINRLPSRVTKSYVA